MKYGVPPESILGSLLFLLYINDIKYAIGCDNVKLFADDISFREWWKYWCCKGKIKRSVWKKNRWCLAHQLLINSEKTIFVFFHAKNMPIPESFDCIQTTYLTIDRVKCVQFSGLTIDENLNCHIHVEHVHNSLVNYFGIFNHVRNMTSFKGFSVIHIWFRTAMETNVDTK